MFEVLITLAEFEYLIANEAIPDLYCLTYSTSTADIRKLAHSHHYDYLYLDGSIVTDKTTFLSEMKRVFNAEDWFRPNWDAAIDYLIGHHTSARGVIFLYEHPELFAHTNPTDFETGLQILNLVRFKWQTRRHKPFYAVISSHTSPSGDAPSYLHHLPAIWNDATYEEQPKSYFYVGSSIIQDELPQLEQLSDRTHIQQPADVVGYIQRTQQPLEDRQLTVTFIINPEGQLWIAHRRSEHVVCAKGGAVLSAGEMTFEVRGTQVEVVEVTNQSAGYCPEPESWGVVAAALDQAGIPHPDSFTSEYHFRQCKVCGSTNLIKEDVYECAVCDSPLNRVWNFYR